MPDAAHGLVLPHLDRARTRPGDASAVAVQPHRAHKRSVAFWLALLVGASVAPVAIVAAILLYHDYYEHQRARLVQDSIVNARALMSAVDRELAASRMALVALASSPYLASGDFARFHAQAREVQRGIGVGAIVLHDASGQQRLNTTQAYGVPHAPEHNAAFREVVRTGKPMVTDLFYGAVTDRPVVAVTLPVFRDGEIVYVLSAGIWSDQLADILTRQRLPDGWIATIFDSTGTIVARTRDLERFRGRKGTPDLMQRIAEVPEDSVDRLSLDGIPVHSSFSRSPESRWSVVIGVPRAHLDGELRTTLLRLAFAVALLLIASLGLASFIGRRVTHDIGALLAPAHALGRGEVVQVPRLGLQEPDDVARALAQTSALLQSALYSAHHDPLTGLVNRAFFEASVHQGILIARRTGGVLALLFVDLDGFKDINDSLGHAAGDDLLRLTAGRITATVRESDVAARLGGDEFAVLLSNTSEEGAHAVAAGLVTALSRPYELGARTGRVSASIGVALYPACATTADALLDSADAAMYAAKAAGRNGWVAARVASVRLSGGARDHGPHATACPAGVGHVSDTCLTPTWVAWDNDGFGGGVVETKPPLPPFTAETATQKVRMAEDAWNTRDPDKVVLVYTEDTRWRNRAEFPVGREEVRQFLRRKWAKELDYRLIKELWACSGNRIAVRFAYEWHDDSGNWYRSYGNENWEFDERGFMQRRFASINDLPIREADRKFRWPLGRRPDDHPGLSDLRL